MLHFLYTADNNYFCHMLTSLYSLASYHVDQKIMVHIIEEGFTTENLKKLEVFQRQFPNVLLRFYPLSKISKLMSKMNLPTYRNSYMPNARLFARELLGVDKVLYIDSDTIIQSNLSDVFDNVNYPVSAVKEVSVPLHIGDKLGCYYNSGVILFDYSEWDKEDRYSILYETMIKNPNLKLPDQDVLNLAFKDQIGTLDFSYNIVPNVVNFMSIPFLAKMGLKGNEKFYTFEEIQNALLNPHIYHLLTVYKCRPWQKNSINPFNDIYDYYRKMWDASYEKEESQKIFAKMFFLPYIDAIGNGVLHSDNYKLIKEKANALIYKR